MLFTHLELGTIQFVAFACDWQDITKSPRIFVVDSKGIFWLIYAYDFFDDFTPLNEPIKDINSFLDMTYLDQKNNLHILKDFCYNYSNRGNTETTPYEFAVFQQEDTGLIWFCTMTYFYSEENNSRIFKKKEET